ncbi:hypothetical protein C3L33_18842, partial [Rhododendron williamsianum]
MGLYHLHPLGPFKTLLNLAKNQLTGFLPVELGNLTKLQELKLQANSFIGEIPIEITQLQLLRKLNISWNSLNGSIPSSISRLQNLNNLDLRGNNLSGSILESIGNLTSLIELQLGSNELGGKIPLMPQSLQIALNLSSNQFEGLLPETLSQLNGLEVLDLSNNRFTGNIPDSFAQMGSLTQLVLSNNRLSGLIPFFPATVSVETTGNPDLIRGTKRADNTRTLFLVVAVSIGGGVFAIFIATMLVLWISSRANKNNDEQIESEEHRSNINASEIGWTQRVNIVEGMAHALSYLHHDCTPPIVHRDISSNNILLNSQHEASVADFGTARLLNPHSSNRTVIAGTYGYIAPAMESENGLCPTIECSDQCPSLKEYRILFSPY